MPINSYYNRHRSLRKPDVVIISLMLRRMLEDTAVWDKFAFNSATDSPKDNFQWKDILLTGEFKCVKSTLPPPPDKYNAEAPQSIPPQTLPLTFSDVDDVPSMAEESLSRARAAVPSSSVSDPGM
jgi:hypothetical protein